MNKHTSLYLDALRFLAALLVFIYHMGHFSRARVPYVGDLGTEAVLIFFVLSGFVISFSSTTKHGNIIDFCLSRLSRLWSVALPALAITVAADIIGQRIDITAYAPIQPLSPLKWLALISANALFINQIWNLDLWPGSNGPFWSLSYEFWYYAVFALAFYLRGRTRLIAVAGAMAIVGPKILIPFPVWLMGVGAQYMTRRASNSNARLGFALWVSSIAMLAAYTAFDVTSALRAVFPHAAAMANATWAVDFWPKSFILGALFALNVYGFERFGERLGPALERHRTKIRALADSSFGLYLFHYPLGYFFNALARTLKMPSYESAIFIYAITFGASMFFALACEKNRRRFDALIKGSARHFRNKISASRSFDGTIEAEEYDEMHRGQGQLRGTSDFNSHADVTGS